MNSRTRKKLYKLIANRDGEICKFCQKGPPLVKLVIDHIDNDNKNNNLQNMQLVCRRCNYLKNPRSNRPVNLCVSSNDSIAINRSKEPRFREYVYLRLNIKGTLEYDDVVNSAAEFLGVSPETTKRYLRKMCSKQGKLEMFMDWDSFNLVYAKRVKSIRYKKEE